MIRLTSSTGRVHWVRPRVVTHIMGAHGGTASGVQLDDGTRIEVLLPPDEVANALNSGEDRLDPGLHEGFTVTRDADGQVVAITITDDEGRIVRTLVEPEGHVTPEHLVELLDNALACLRRHEEAAAAGKRAPAELMRTTTAVRECIEAKLQEVGRV